MLITVEPVAAFPEMGKPGCSLVYFVFQTCMQMLETN